MGILNPKDNKLSVFSDGNDSNNPIDLQKQPQSEETIRTWLIFNLSELAEIEPQDIDIQQPFAYYGLDSRQAAILSGELQDWLGCRLPPTLVYDYPNIEVLARYLAGKA
jgi:8-amino-7-oxononanoate synthase